MTGDGPTLYAAEDDGVLACAWFWEDCTDNNQEHVCVRRPGHTALHACWCGRKHNESSERRR